MRPEVATGIAILCGCAGVVLGGLILTALNRVADAFERVAKKMELDRE